MPPEKALVFIALAIKLRDNAHKLSDDEFKELVNELALYGVMSNRQLAKLTKNRMTHVAIGKFIAKTNKTGGSVNPSDLEKIRAIIFSKSVRKTDYRLAREVVDNGTSYGMLFRLTKVRWEDIKRERKVSGLIQQKGAIQ